MARGLKFHALSSDCQPSIMGFDKFIIINCLSIELII